MNKNDMVRGINMKAVSNWMDQHVRPLTEVLVVTIVEGDTITAKNGAGDVYEGTTAQFQPVFQNLVRFHYSDVDIQRANAAHNGTSFSPERRGYLYADGYVSDMSEMDEYFSQFVTDENREALCASLEWYRKKYLELMWAYLHSHANCMSAMIAGPSNFPGRQAEKRRRWADNHLNEWVEWRKSARTKLERMYNPKARSHAPISADDDDAPERLKAKIEKLEKLQAWMKAANAIIRKKSLTDDQKIAKLQADCGIGEQDAKMLLHPKEAWMGVGFPAYRLTNNLATIKTAKQRLADVEKKRADVTKEQEFGDVRVVDSVEDNRVQVFFPGKPKPETLTFLKKNGFRWTPTAGAWQHYRSTRAWNIACDAAKMAGANN
jgi:hypothetical protein